MCAVQAWVSVFYLYVASCLCVPLPPLAYFSRAMPEGGKGGERGRWCGCGPTVAAGGRALQACFC